MLTSNDVCNHKIKLPAKWSSEKEMAQFGLWSMMTVSSDFVKTFLYKHVS